MYNIMMILGSRSWCTITVVLLYVSCTNGLGDDGLREAQNINHINRYDSNVIIDSTSLYNNNDDMQYVVDNSNDPFDSVAIRSSHDTKAGHVIDHKAMNDFVEMIKEERKQLDEEYELEEEEYFKKEGRRRRTQASGKCVKSGSSLASSVSKAGSTKTKITVCSSRIKVGGVRRRRRRLQDSDNSTISTVGGINFSNRQITLVCTLRGKRCLIDGQRISRLFYGTNVTLSIKKFDFINANANDTMGSGGALSFFSNSQISISQSSFFNNRARRGGGAIMMVDNSTLFLDNEDTSARSTIRFINNRGSETTGGAIYSINSTVVTTTNETSVIFGNNKATNGGAIYMIGGEISLNKTIMNTNIAYNEGGVGVFIGVKVVLNHVNTSYNNATYQGGSFVFNESNVNIANTIARNNIANQFAGAIVFYETNGTLTNVLIDENSAPRAGGIGFILSNINLTNTRFEQNIGDTAGGATNIFKSRLLLVDCKFFDNKGGIGGGNDIYVSDNSNNNETFVFCDDTVFCNGTSELNVFDTGNNTNTNCKSKGIVQTCLAPVMPSQSPSFLPTRQPSIIPTIQPSMSVQPTMSQQPTLSPSISPIPTNAPIPTCPIILSGGYDGGNTFEIRIDMLATEGTIFFVFQKNYSSIDIDVSMYHNGDVLLFNDSYREEGTYNEIASYSGTDTKIKLNLNFGGVLPDRYVDSGDLWKILFSCPVPFTDVPSGQPSFSVQPSEQPSLSVQPSFQPSVIPTLQPSLSVKPSDQPSVVPTIQPSLSVQPSHQPSLMPSIQPSLSVEPSLAPSGIPSMQPSMSAQPSLLPSIQPSILPSATPTLQPSLSFKPSTQPSLSVQPSQLPSFIPSIQPSTSVQPSQLPSLLPTNTPVCPIAQSGVGINATFAVNLLNTDGVFDFTFNIYDFPGNVTILYDSATLYSFDSGPANGYQRLNIGGPSTIIQVFISSPFPGYGWGFEVSCPYFT